MNQTAQELSKRKYSTVVRLEKATDDSYVYIAFHPELPNCMSHGAMVKEAVANLEEATVLVIEHLLEYNLPIPEPQVIVPTEMGSGRAQPVKPHVDLQPRSTPTIHAYYISACPDVGGPYHERL